MSLSLIAWNPRIDEPSKPSPSRIIPSSSVAAGIEKCCHVPGRSQNLRSTTWMLFCLISSNSVCTSLLVDLRVEVVGRRVVAMVLSVSGLRCWVIKDEAPALADRTQGHRVSTGTTQCQGPGGSIRISGRFRWLAGHWGWGLGPGRLSCRMRISLPLERTWLLARVYRWVYAVSRDLCILCKVM